MQRISTPSGLTLFLLTVLTCINRTTTQELLDANFLGSGQARIDLLSPMENQQVTTVNPTLSWSSRGVGLYTLELAADATFVNVVLSKDVSGISYTVANTDLSGMNSLTTGSYFWRVKVAKITNNLQSKTGFFFLIAIPASGSGYAGALYVNASSLTTAQVGSKEAPYKKIQGAISAADTLRNGANTISMDILVAKGNYTEEISMSPGISLRGGYESSAWTRDTLANSTIITGLNDVAIRCGNGITSTTEIEGLTINGGSGDITYGIFLAHSSPRIWNNTISGGGGISYAYGIYNTSSSPTISNNKITGSTIGGGFHHGIYNNLSSPVISGNTITGGGNGIQYGINNNLSSPTIFNNTLLGGSGTGTDIAIENCNSSSPTIFNNAIFGGSGAGIHYGIDVCGGGAPVIMNNTINGGSAGSNIYAIYVTGGATPTIKNNILFCSGGTNRYGVYENTITSDPAATQNNNIYGCTTALYYDFDSGCGGTTNCTIAQLNALGIGYSGNISIDNTANQLFLNINGPDGNITTMSDNDWHLTANAAICDVRGGGLNLSGSFTTDKDSLARTVSAISGCAPSNTGATNWSIGAYESD